MERLTPLATAFLDAEDADSHVSLAIGSFAVFAGPAPGFDEFVRRIESRLPLIPRYRQKLRTVPFSLAPPAWVDAADFELSWHVRNTGLPSPGGPAEIGRLISRVMAQRMDRSRPLWECWFCEGLPEGRWALLTKVHHSMVDGVSATDLYRLILDLGPEATPPECHDWRPALPQSALSFAGRALWDLAWSPVAGARVVGTALRSPRQLVRRAGHTANGLLALTSALRPVQHSSLTGPLGASRRYAWTTVSMSDVQTVRHHLGGTVNDVALAAVTGGFRALLLSRGEAPSEHTLRSLVPVSTRAPGAESVLDNRVSLLLPYLPVDLNDPRERLAAVQERVSAPPAPQRPCAV